jgi:hypothetical protein
MNILKICQAEVDADNRIFLHDLDSAISDLQKWKDMRSQNAEDAEETSSLEGDNPETEERAVREREVFSLPLQSARMADEKAVRNHQHSYYAQF